MRRDEIDRSSRWARWSVAGLLGTYLLLAGWLLWRTAILSVFSDQFDWVTSVYDLQRDHRWLAYALAPHNINRLVWTRLFVAWDVLALRGTNAPLIVSGALALAATAATLGRQAARAGPPALKPPLAALAVVLTLVAGNVLDASTPIYVTYAHAAVFAVLALSLSEGAVASPFGARGAAAILCGIFAGFGSGAGLAVWPVMAYGALRRRDWPWLALVTACGGLFVTAYLSGQHGGAGQAAAPALQDPKSAAILALSYLTLPFTRLALYLAWIGGAAIAAVSLVAALRCSGRQASPAQRVAAGFILFSLTTAAMAGLGRSGSADPYNAPLRYGLLVAPLQTGLLMLAAPWLGRLWRANRGLVEAGLTTAIAALLAFNLVFAAKAVAANDLIRETIADFQAGQRTPRMTELIYPSLDAAARMDARMRREGLYRHELHLKSRPGSV